MKLNPKIKGGLLGLALCGLCVLGSGCDTLSDSLVQSWEYDRSVDAYKDSGMSQKDAEKKAQYDQDLDKVINGPLNNP